MANSLTPACCLLMVRLIVATFAQPGGIDFKVSNAAVYIAVSVLFSQINDYCVCTDGRMSSDIHYSSCWI